MKAKLFMEVDMIVGVTGTSTGGTMNQLNSLMKTKPSRGENKIREAKRLSQGGLSQGILNPRSYP